MSRRKKRSPRRPAARRAAPSSSRSQPPPQPGQERSGETLRNWLIVGGLTALGIGGATLVGTAPRSEVTEVAEVVQGAQVIEVVQAARVAPVAAVVEAAASKPVIGSGAVSAADSRVVAIAPGPAAPPVLRTAAARPGASLRYLKGSTHVHTGRSGDSSTPIADVIRWYTEHHYDFIIITDHNRVTLHQHRGDLLVMPGVELTHNPAFCLPRPPEPRGKCRIHINSLIVDPASERARARRAGQAAGERINWRERTSRLRIDMYQRALATTDQLGGLAQLNHPAWHRGVDGQLLAELGRRGLVLVEIANQAFTRWNRGTGRFPSTEAIWDEALSAGVIVWGVASDDAHHYYDAPAIAAAGRTVYPAGPGFVMVRAERTPDAIRAALARGDFYSSTGVVLAAIEHAGDRLTVQVASGEAHEIRFIGPGGQVLAEHVGRRAGINRGARAYVRAVVRDSQGRKAWVQPFFAD
ncbi:MAG: hypothetical protein MJE77_15425 [Proteobacteria bacterium]|nr:hypothetical protein [Pseudomonadota bacterium]